ncbi:MAG: hypothetical protein Terrestrivirus1_313 [Terrestrivirus sp.]|uniref:Uncharacterized protein n=1 Tax=Terrestrivirus sp. TaxID=2487775 RepID=A0A3G4ZPR7_9VIRU|nr:MAG: hypothetical protein Terrestrivirus1_313 [Terrestrivirus sp.]
MSCCNKDSDKNSEKNSHTNIGHFNFLTPVQKKSGLMYLVGAWVDTATDSDPNINPNYTFINFLQGINFIPQKGSQISWLTQSIQNINTGLPGIINIPAPGQFSIPSQTIQGNHWNMQAPTFSQQFQFPVFPLRVSDGDKFQFIIQGVVDAIAVAINVDGIIYRTFNNQNQNLNANKITLVPNSGTIVSPTYSPVPDIVTFVNTPNFVAVGGTLTPTTILTWTVKL